MKASIIIGLIAVLVLASIGYAIPEGPGSIINGSQQRRTLGVDSTNGYPVPAQAGNVTALFINSTKITQRWQGYFGNVTGTITLDDGNNMTLYNWQMLSPNGEIYASNGTAGAGAVTWTSVYCFNYSNNLSDGSQTVQRFNGTGLESSIGSATGDKDSVNATFNASFTGSFRVGATTIDSEDGCRQATLNVNDVYQTTDFVEVLLTDNNSIIYTALLEQDTTGFQNSPVDFEMIVGENGDVAAATNYYFFVELS